MNFEVLRHLTVPDERALMVDALEYCHRDCGLILTTGGLGPTRDDFTREVIAEWTGKDLRFHQQSWDAIEQRLSLKGLPIAAANRQQCYYPEGSQILENPAGTAQGFMVTIRQLDSSSDSVVVLPGPPREIEAIWDSGLSAKLTTLAPQKPQRRLWYWHCTGISESHLGEIVEKALEGSGYLTGYRPHSPYVDVKVWTPTNVLRETDRYLLALDQAIKAWTVSRERS
jgi:molybdopterin-biosynthesis enzyme MoeA-like protein